ncbi:MAG: iron-sulfur cluster assembly scaffold protein [Desulfobacterales bacterium]|nr:iron-sulfur cluster assembly scaffold protein [Desulfobacterales bacterium]
MDEAVRKYYRRLMETHFEHEGKFEDASIFVETAGGNTGLCAAEDDFMRLYVNVVNNSIYDIKYLCVCDPTANVAVEVLCALLKGKSLDEAAGLPEEAFYQYLGGKDDDLQKMIKGLKELLKGGISDYQRKRYSTTA